jgi:hypothetical protein
MVAVLAIALPPHGKSDERPQGCDKPGLGLPPLTGDDAVGVDIHDLNIRLRNQYRELARTRGRGGAVKDASRALSETLDKLVKKDAALKKLGKDEIDRDIRSAAERNRTEALVHAWASFSILAAETDRLAEKGDFAGADLAPLVALPGPSVLSHLLDLTGQVAASRDADEEHRKAEKAAGGQIDLIRFRLKDKFIFGVELAYDHAWLKGERPAFMKHHDRYIPSFDDLIGGHADVPEPQRDLLSLWGLVNLVADRECQLSRGSGDDVSKRLTDLAEWLASLRGHRAMKVVAAVAAAKPSLDGRLLTPLEKLESFHRFREAATQPDTLAGMASQLADFRREDKGTADGIRGRLLQRLRKAASKDALALNRLIEAAAPIGDAAQSLPHAAAWLRYVLLLSYKGQRTLVADEKLANGMAEAWGAFGTGLPLAFEVTAKPWAGGRGAPAVRWNLPPHAGQSSAVVADLALACLGHLRFDAFAAGRQKERFAALRTAGTAKDYFDKGFDEALDGLEIAYCSRLAPYFVRKEDEQVSATFPPPGEPARLAEVELHRKGQREIPAKGDDPHGPAWRAAFVASATLAERRRLRDDLVVLAIEMQRGIQVQKAVRDAVKGGKPAGLQMLASLGGPGLADLGELPRKTFPQYKKDLDQRIKELKEKVTQAEAERSLAQAYSRSRGELEQARAELDAARLGRRVAEKASELSEIFKQIADLDLQIEELGVQMAVLDGKIAEKRSQATELRLVGATRLRDLAARKVEALIAASEQAKEIAEKAAEDIDKLGTEFKKAAEKIEEQERRARAFGILKAVITVVGAALAPFTGGASLTVAMMVNTAVDIYKRIDETDWKDFGTAVATVAEVAGKAGAIAETGIKNFGGPKAREALGKVQNFIKDRKRDVEKWKGDAERLWEGLKKIKEGKAADAVAAIANGFPVSTDNMGRLQIDFGKKSIRFEDAAIQEALQGLLRSGRYILNDAEERGKEALAKLTGLPSAELKKKLGETLDQVVKDLPPDIAAGIKDLPKNAGDEGKKALERLKGRIAGMRDDDPSLRLLAQTLSGGMLFIRDGKGVIAVERPFAEEARKLQDRLERHARTVAEGAIGTLVKKIDGIRDELDRQGQALLKESKAKELRELADKAIEPAIKRVKDAVSELQTEIKKAEDQLSDAKEQELIATYEAEAVRLVLERTVSLKEQAELRRKRAEKVVEQARLAAKIEVLRGEQSLALLRAAEAKVARLEDLVRYRFDRCLANGVNPLSRNADEPERLPLPTASLRGVLSGHLSLLDAENRPVVEAAAAEALGMIRWCEMLGVSGGVGKTPIDYYATLLSDLTSRDDAKAVCVRIKAIGAEVDKLFAKQAGIRTKVRYTNPKITPANLIWRDGERAAEVEAILSDIPSVYHDKVLGAFRYRVDVEVAGTAALPETTREVFPEPKVLLDSSAAYFIDRNKIRLILDRENFYFVVIPPAVVYSSPGRPLVFGPQRDTNGRPRPFEKQEVTSSEEAEQQKEKIESDLGLLKGVDLTGALGEWTVLIIKSNAGGQAKRDAAIREIKNDGLRFTLRMYYLEVKQ